MSINYRHIEDRLLEKCAITINNITYNMLALQEFYSEIKHFAVDYSSIRGNAVAGLFSSIKVESMEGKEWLDYPIITDLVSKFNPVDRPIENGNISIVVYQPGFNFHPHTDFSRKAVIMFPIYPIDGGAPIDFYTKEILENATKDNRPAHDEKYYIGSVFYSTKHPTIMNTDMPHGVRNVDNERVYLQFSVYDEYDYCAERIKSGEFLNV